MKLPRRKFDASVPSVAMADIAFLLLIFLFILARSQDDSHLKWEPAAQPALTPAGSCLASVTIDADHRTFLNGRELSGSALTTALQEALGDAPAGKRVVHFKVHRGTPARFFEPALEAIGEAGGDLVHILKEEDQPPRQP
jgi:biopolymer transport protein ExbD